MTVTVDIAQFGSGLVVLLFVAVILFILVMGWKKVRHWFASRRFERHDLEAMRRRWREIEEMASQPGEMGRKMAILEADKLLDMALKTMMMSGNTLGERLKFACYKWPGLREVWWAHRIRNQMAHESSFHLDSAVAVKAIRTYRAALRLMGAI